MEEINVNGKKMYFDTKSYNKEQQHLKSKDIGGSNDVFNGSILDKALKQPKLQNTEVNKEFWTKEEVLKLLNEYAFTFDAKNKTVAEIWEWEEINLK